MIKAQRFWSKALKEKVKRANKALATMDVRNLEKILDELITMLQDKEANWKDRVAICFILEQMASIDPLMEKIVDGLMKVLENEEDPHVKEFTVWALGKITEESQSLELIKETIPVLVRFLNDDSEQVKNLAYQFHVRLQESLKEKEELDSTIKELRTLLLNKIEESFQDMKNRSDAISKEALALDYQAAYEKREEMKKIIKQFQEKNQELEDEIIQLQQSLIKKVPAFKGEGKELIRLWKEKRAEKEDLIRRVECIIRIQSKIYNIIQFILEHTDSENINLDDITEITKKTGRPYTRKEVIEILQQLVDEEIIPNFMLDQIKDYEREIEKIEKHDENKE